MEKTHNRRLVKTEKGYIGLAGMNVGCGHDIFVCEGGKFPLVVKKDNRGRLRLVGDCYVHGIMGGEAFDERRCECMWFS